MKKKIISIFLLLFLSVSVFAVGILDDTPRIAVVSAFGPELAPLKNQTENTNQYVINGRSFTTGKLKSHDVVLFYSGVSMVNAAMTMQLGFDHFNIERVVFSGIAGGVDPSLNIGDVVIPQQWAQYQEALYAREVDVNQFDTGYHSAPFENYGMIFPQTVSVTSNRVDPDDFEEMFWFSVDEEMLEVARNLNVELLQSVNDASLSYQPKLVLGGNGVSGMTFVDNAEYREYVFDTFLARCLDMESAAIAHVSYANEIPFVVFRSLSDLAGGGEGENEIGTFFQLAADNAAAVLLAWLEEWE